jgi:predicted ester cyclase
MSIEENKAIAIQITKAHTPGTASKLHEVLSPDFIWHIAGPPPRTLNREEYIQGVEMGMQCLSHQEITIEDVIAEGEKVVLRVKIRGTHTGTFLGVAPTGKQVEFTNIFIRRIVDGKIAEEWQSPDMLSLLQQRGTFSPNS